jgi:hypothetical protein
VTAPVEALLHEIRNALLPLAFAFALERGKAAAVCGGVLAYETMAGAFRVHKAGVYRFRCPKCGHEGTNDGALRTCDWVSEVSTRAASPIRGRSPVLSHPSPREIIQ